MTTKQDEPKILNLYDATLVFMDMICSHIPKRDESDPNATDIDYVRRITERFLNSIHAHAKFQTCKVISLNNNLEMIFQSARDALTTNDPEIIRETLAGIMWIAENQPE